MITVLHAGFVRGELTVWAETGDEPRPARRSAAAVGPDIVTLQAVLGRILPGPPPPAHDAVVWLPTAADRPVPSLPILGATAAEADTRLAAWQVASAHLTVPSALALLRRCKIKGLLAPGVLAGADLLRWADIAELGLNLVARQMVLPTLRDTTAGLQSVWQPLLGPRDEAILAALVRAMPPAGRALGTADAPPAAPARALAESFLAAIVNHLMRPATAPYRSAGQTPHDHWVFGLLQPAGAKVAAGPDLGPLRADIAAWADPLRGTAVGGHRLCLRLEEPPEDGETWRVHYLLQALDDPSLLVAAEDIWADRRRRKAAVMRPEHLLAVLGAAARISPEIASSLKEPHPTGYSLDSQGAHSFLTETVWALEQAGLGIQLPGFWTRRESRSLTARATAQARASSGRLGLDSVVEFSWQVALGDDVLTQAELEELARLKAPLVRVRGQWVEISQAEVQAGLALLQGRGPRSATLRDTLQMAITGSAPKTELEVGAVEGGGAVGELLDRLLQAGAPQSELPAPPGLLAQLRPYQQRGYAWLAFLADLGLGACLADDMGLGKTLQTLALLQRDWESGGQGPTLLVCPTSVLSQWQSEAGRFTPDLPVLVHHGPERLQDEAFAQAVAGQALVVTSYSLLHRDLPTLQRARWHAVVLDEAQNIKNPATHQAKAARAISAPCRIALTGTPVENHVLDLWSIMEFLNPGLLGSQQAFMRRFFVPIQREGSASASRRLRRMTTPFVLRRLKTDPAVAPDLPDKIETKVHCPLTREQATLYKAVLQDLEAGIDAAEGMSRRGLILATLTKLKQVCNHPAHFLQDASPLGGRSGKLARLAEMLEEIRAAGEKVLIFTQFREMGALLKGHLEETLGEEVLFLHGQVPREERSRMVARFQADEGGPSLFILSLKAGGTGLNLTRARHVFHFDRWWNPAVEDQATDRAFRIGQTQQVQVHKFVCLGTVEERIDQMMESKRQVADSLVGAGESWLTELSTAELRGLFRLDATAVED